MVQCFAVDCNHQGLRETCSMLRFPSKKRMPAERIKWEKMCQRADREVQDFDRLCSCHFKDGQRRNGPIIFTRNESNSLRVKIPAITFEVQCPFCLEIFESLASLAEHKRHVHEFVCGEDTPFLGTDIKTELASDYSDKSQASSTDIKAEIAIDDGRLDVSSVVVKREPLTNDDSLETILMEYDDVPAALKTEDPDSEAAVDSGGVNHLCENQVDVGIDTIKPIAVKKEDPDSEASHDGEVVSHLFEKQDALWVDVIQPIAVKTEHPDPEAKLDDEGVSYQCENQDALGIDSIKPSGLSSEESALRFVLAEPPCANRYECNYCKETFFRQADLEAHALVHKKLHQCHVCMQPFSTALRLKAHMQDHPGEKTYLHECNVCPGTFFQQSELEEHMRVHKTKHQCSICLKPFPTSFLLKVHKRVHVNEKPPSNYCKICFKVFSDTENFEYHKKEHTCIVCRKEFSDLMVHMQVHIAENQFICSVCGKNSSSSKRFEEHMRVHALEKRFTCSVCQQVFSKKGNLKAHMRVHSGEKLFTCNICEKGFSRNKSLKVHMRLHNGERPFICSVCEKGFSSSRGLTDHMQLHTDERPFS